MSSIPNYGSTLRFLLQLQYWDLMIWIIGVSERKKTLDKWHSKQGKWIELSSVFLHGTVESRNDIKRQTNDTEQYVK